MTIRLHIKDTFYINTIKYPFPICELIWTLQFYFKEYTCLNKTYVAIIYRILCNGSKVLNNAYKQFLFDRSLPVRIIMDNNLIIFQKEVFAQSSTRYKTIILYKHIIILKKYQIIYT